MEFEESINEIINQLRVADDWLVRGMAVRKLVPFGVAAVPHLELLFSLTFDPKAPVQACASSIIKRLGNAATPFLLR